MGQSHLIYDCVSKMLKITSYADPILKDILEFQSIYKLKAAPVILYSGTCIVQHLSSPELSRSDIISVHNWAFCYTF